MLGHRLHGGSDWDVALGFWLNEHLLGHCAAGAGNDFETLGGWHLDDLLGLGFKARADDDVGEAIAVAGQERDRTRKVVIKVVIALLHRDANQLASGVGIQVDRHVRAVRHVLTDERRAHAVAAL